MVSQSAIDTKNPIEIIRGGTSNNTLTVHSVLVGEGSSPLTQLTVGTNGQVLIGTGVDPAFGTITSSLGSLSYTLGANSLNIDVANWVDKTTFSPTLDFSGLSSGLTYTSTGFYNRYGNVVFVNGKITLTAVGISVGNAEIGALPIKSSSGDTYLLSVYLTNINTATTTASFYASTSNATTAQLFNQTTSGITAITNANFGNTTTITFSGVYLV